MQSFLTDGPRSMLKADHSPEYGVRPPGVSPPRKGNGAIECSTIASKACERGRGRSSGARRQPNKTGQARLRHPGGGAETGGRRQAATASIKARKQTSKIFLARSHLRRFPFGDDRLVVFVFFSILDQSRIDHGRFIKKNMSVTRGFRLRRKVLFFLFTPNLNLRGGANVTH